MSVILSLRRVSQEKGITRATQGKKEVWSRVTGGTGEGCVGLHNYMGLHGATWGYITTYRTMEPL